MIVICLKLPVKVIVWVTYYCSSFQYIIKSYLILKTQQMDQHVLTYITSNVTVTLKQLKHFYYYQNTTIWPTFNSGFYQIGNDCNLSEIESKGQSFCNIFFAVHTDVIWNDTRFSKYNTRTNLNKQDKTWAEFSTLDTSIDLHHTLFHDRKTSKLKVENLAQTIDMFSLISFCLLCRIPKLCKIGNHC